MLTARSVFREIIGDDKTFQLFASIAAVGEAQGGWENAEIASRLPDSLRQLKPKVIRHGQDEDKHGRIFVGLLRNRGLSPCPVPDDVNYTALLERRGIGIGHQALRRAALLEERDVVVYLAHSRVTEQRASEQMATLRKYFGADPRLGRALSVISADEDNHLAYSNEELLNLVGGSLGPSIREELVSCAHAEIDVYRDVSLAFVRRVGALLHWSRAKRAMLMLGVHVLHRYERSWGWRRMVKLTPAVATARLVPTPEGDMTSARADSRPG